MPLYEYECEKCGHTFELRESITAEPRKRCPVCRGKVRRLISPNIHVLFKGNGFYCTDYRSEEYKRREREDRERGKKSSGSSGGDSGSKP
jgi:putative FmdB family regulatory protein